MYISTSDANSYFEGKFDIRAWVNATEDQRRRAITEAGRLIDSFAYLGSKTDSDQEHQFPRNGDTTIPTNMTYACAEIAYTILDGFDIDQHMSQLNLTSQGFGSARATWSRNDMPEHLKYGIPSLLAYSYMLPYFRRLGEIGVSKV